jgi:exopolysaccharide biosynthesis polyprenyl glycosylphosphotransferase
LKATHGGCCLKESVSLRDEIVGAEAGPATGAAADVERFDADSAAIESVASRQRETILRRLLGLADACAISAALVVSAVIVGGDSLTTAAVAVPPLFILLAKSIGLYDRDAELLHKTTLDEVPKLLSVAIGTVLLLWLADGAVIEGEITRPQVLSSLLILLVGLIVLRSGARFVGIRSSAVERCIFVGDESSADELRQKLATSPSVRAELVGWLPVDSGTGDLLALPERIRLLVLQADVHRIILGPGATSEELLDSIRRIKDNGVKLSVMLNVARLVNASVELDRLNGITLLGLRPFDMTLSSRLIKRTFDLVGSTFALLVLSPVLVLTVIAIKIDSRGPIVFRQIRAGRYGEPFVMMKFRSMVDGADQHKDGLRHLNESDGLFKITADPRVTRIGRLIRRLNVDELPQLVNVLRGEMSLVGPRPLVLEEDNRIEGWHRRRLDLRPGITGSWQILGSSRIPFQEMVKLDYQYVADWSLWNDIRILLLTLGHVANRRGQ